jgi:hypothetical protein
VELALWRAGGVSPMPLTFELLGGFRVREQRLA